MEQNINSIIALLVFILIGVTYLIGGLILVGAVVAILVVYEVYKFIKILREN